MVGVHVANGAGCAIYVRLAHDRSRSFESFNIGVKGVGVGTKLNHTEALKAGFATLAHSDDFNYAQNWDWVIAIGLGSANFVTIVTENGHMVCDNLELMHDQNIIVTRQYSIKKARAGRVWRDNDGNYHGDRVCGTCKKARCQNDGH